MSESATQDNTKQATITASEDVVNGKTDAVEKLKEPDIEVATSENLGEVATSEKLDDSGNGENPISNGDGESQVILNTSEEPTANRNNGTTAEKEIKTKDDKMEVEQTDISASNNTATDEKDKQDSKEDSDKKDIVEESNTDGSEKDTEQEVTPEKLETDKENKEDTNDDKNGNSDDKEEDESSDEELPPGLLERPVEIYNEKRQRKKVTRFIPDEVSTPSPSKKVVEIKSGAGTKLSSHPRVCWQLNKNKIADLKLVHKLLYGVWGEQKTIKSNILQFSGFTFEKDSKEYEKKEEYLGGFTMDNLKWLMECCDVKVKGNKDDQLEALMNWCMCPKPSGKETPNAKKKKTPKKKTTESSSAEGETEDGDSASSTKKATKRKSTSKATVKINSPSSAKKAKKTPNSTPNKPPTNAQIVKCVKKILDGANLEEITMKTVCVQVYAQYPQFDLSSKKAFIKETVRKVIS